MSSPHRICSAFDPHCLHSTLNIRFCTYISNLIDINTLELRPLSNLYFEYN